MKYRRLQQITFGLIAAMSLVAAPLAACVCSHHEPVQATAASCDHHAEKSVQTDATASDAVELYADSSNEECVCLASATALPNSDNSKSQKSYVLAPSRPFEAASVTTVPFRQVVTTRPRAVTLESYESFTPSRGPPRA